MSRFGTSNQTGKCTFPEDGRFKKEIPRCSSFKSTKYLKISKKFQQLAKIGRLESKLTELLNDFLHPLNCYCAWVFKKHCLRKSASRKSSPYFRCEATCKVEGCNDKVKITINEKNDRFRKFYS